VCDLEGVGVPSIFKTIRSPTTLVRMLKTLDLSCEENVRAVTVVYYQSIKREVKRRPVYECRCDERLQSKVEEII